MRGRGREVCVRAGEAPDSLTRAMVCAGSSTAPKRTGHCWLYSSSSRLATLRAPYLDKPLSQNLRYHLPKRTGHCWLYSSSSRLATLRHNHGFFPCRPSP